MNSGFGLKNNKKRYRLSRVTYSVSKKGFKFYRDGKYTKVFLSKGTIRKMKWLYT